MINTYLDLIKRLSYASSTLQCAFPSLFLIRQPLYDRVRPVKLFEQARRAPSRASGSGATETSAAAPRFATSREAPYGPPDDKGDFLRPAGLPALELGRQLQRTPLLALHVEQNGERVGSERAYDAPSLICDAFALVTRRTLAQFRNFDARKPPQPLQILITSARRCASLVFPTQISRTRIRVRMKAEG